MAKAKPGNKKVRRKSRQVNQYDKILKENIEAALPGLIRNLLNIHAVNTEELPDDIQHTKERKPDVLKRVTDEKENTFVLHIEFQVQDEPNMVFRMAEYYIMLLRRYELPVRQYVIYIGAGNPTMTDHIRSESMNFTYQLIPLSKIDYHLLLRSDRPEEKMLAILADLGRGDPKRTIENIVSQVVATSEGNFSKLRHVQQLRILSQLRNLALDNLEIMDSVADFMSEEKDIFYRRGEKKGLEKGKIAVIKNLLLHTDFTIAKIASLTDVTEDFVKNVKKTLKKKTLK
jgi:predicted transposase/invertase (TIGR01784 family)